MLRILNVQFLKCNKHLYPSILTYNQQQDHFYNIVYISCPDIELIIILSTKCSQSRVFISPHHMNQTILCVLASMVHVALRPITAQYQIQIFDENTCIHSYTDRVTNITV